MPIKRKLALNHYVKPYKHQLDAVRQLRNGSILVGGVGSGKSLTALLYYYDVVCGGDASAGISPRKSVPLYVITTARKRDSLDWDREAARFGILPESDRPFVVDSWNNIKKYVDVMEPSFFIFDEQRLVGSGVWVKSFLKIAKRHQWLLLTATPGDTWLDYIPVFLAHGFYRNRTEFIRRHVIYKPFRKFPIIDRIVGVSILEGYRDHISVVTRYKSKSTRHIETILVEYDKSEYQTVLTKRWNPETNAPVKNISELIFALRRVVNKHPSRLNALRKLLRVHSRLITFYNFNYERDALRLFAESDDIFLAEYNGEKHDPVPNRRSWLYIVQYTAGAEAWECTTTDAMVFYSLNYSYRVFVQAMGRIDRMNTPYNDLYYYRLVSDAPIDKAINNDILQKRSFNERLFLSQ